jgi:hypothetical protein
LLSFSQDGNKGNSPEWSLGSVIICLVVLKIEKCLSPLMSTTVTLCFDNGLQLNPAIVHGDVELTVMKVLSFYSLAQMGY